MEKPHADMQTFNHSSAELLIPMPISRQAECLLSDSYLSRMFINRFVLGRIFIIRFILNCLLKDTGTCIMHMVSLRFILDILLLIMQINPTT